jgi:ABC-2 type transport system permease protein
MAVTDTTVATRDRSRVIGFSLADAWRSFRTAIGLGWAVESNWSDPFLFAVYTVAKPLAAALILVLMFTVITGGQQGEFLEFLIVGSALWQIVFGVLAGLVLGILEDRERYRMIKYVVLTPASLFPFLLGRSTARLGISFLAVAITIGVGVFFLGVDLRPNLPLFVIATLVGVPAVIALGIFMAGWCMQLRQEAWSYPEAIAGSLYLISGAIFPIDVLPAFFQPFAYAFPTTWWLEASRRGLLGHGAPGQLGTFSDGIVVLLLVVTTLVTIGISLVAFRWFLNRARQLGILDMTTSG